MHTSPKPEKFHAGQSYVWTQSVIHDGFSSEGQ